jgi:pimeloyl-ACP methyl ester carboxylesterase
MIVRLFAEADPKEVAGVVLVDAYSEDAQLSVNGKMQRMRLLAKNRPIPAPRTSVTAQDELTPTELQEINGFLKQMGTPKIRPPYNKLPEYAQQVRLWAVQQPKNYAQDDDYMAEISARVYAEDQSKKHPLGDVALIVLTRGRYDYPGPLAASLTREHQEQQARMAQLSSRSRQITVADSRHEIQIDAPDSVIAAIQEVMASAAK